MPSATPGTRRAPRAPSHTELNWVRCRCLMQQSYDLFDVQAVFDKRPTRLLHEHVPRGGPEDRLHFVGSGHASATLTAWFELSRCSVEISRSHRAS